MGQSSNSCLAVATRRPTALGHLLTEAIYLLLPGHCRHREDNENAPGACGTLRAKTDQSGRVSLEWEDEMADVTCSSSLFISLLLSLDNRRAFWPQVDKGSSQCFWKWLQSCHPLRTSCWMCSFVSLLRLLVKRVPHSVACLPDCMLLSSPVFLSLWVMHEYPFK